MAVFNVVHYQCYKCGALDSDRLRDGEFAAPIVNCAGCGAGRGMEVSDMLNRKVGMKLLTPEEWAQVEAHQAAKVKSKPALVPAAN